MPIVLSIEAPTPQKKSLSPRLSTITTLLFAVIMTTIFLSGCAQRPVEVLRPNDFATMAHRLDATLRQQGLVDSQGLYLAGTPLFEQNFYRPLAFGQELFARLSPWYQDVPLSPNEANASFSHLVTDKELMNISAGGFSAIVQNNIITVAIVAIADWNNDGIRDWILVSHVRPLLSDVTTVYYLNIDAPQEYGVLYPTILAAFACHDQQCTEVPLETLPAIRALEQPRIIEAMPGEQITLPPSSSLVKTSPAPSTEQILTD